jgi:hypothetical protein
VNKETRAEVTTNFLQTVKVNVVTKVSTRIVADFYFISLFLKFSNNLLEVNFCVDRLVQFHVLTNLLHIATITIVVRNGKVFIIIPTGL